MLLLFLFALPEAELFSQIQPDTIGIHKRKFHFQYQGKTIKRSKQLGQILLQKPVDSQVRSYWNEYKTLQTIGVGIEVVGIGLMAADLAQTLQGNDSKTLLLTGAGTLLVGAIINGFVATPRAKAAAKRYNDLKTGKNLPIPPPTPIDQLDTLSGRINQTITNYPPQYQQTKTFPSSYFGLAFGPGWSKQKINYEFAFDDEFRSGHVFSLGLQYGQRVSERLGWQLELGLSEHGYRMKKTDFSGGVKINVKADARIQYLELPVSLTYRIPVGEKGFEIIAMPGLSAGYAVSAKVVANGEGENESRKVTTKVREKVSLKDLSFDERLDAALLFSGQVAYPVGPGNVFLEARYHFGILNLERNTERGDKAFNRSLFLRFGYRYAL